MVDLWPLIGFFVISLMGGMITGAVALMLGGMGSVRVLRNRLEALESRQDDQADILTREVKKRASQKGVEARMSVKEAEEAAQATLALGNPQMSPYSDPRVPRRPSVITSIHRS